VLVGNGLRVKIGKGALRIDRVGVRVIRVPDNVLAFEISNDVLERALVAVARFRKNSFMVAQYIRLTACGFDDIKRS